MPTTCNCGMCDNYSFFQDQNNEPRREPSRNNEERRTNGRRTNEERDTVGGYGTGLWEGQGRSTGRHFNDDGVTVGGYGTGLWEGRGRSSGRRTNDAPIVYGPVRYADNSAIPYSHIIVETSEHSLPIAARPMSRRVPPRRVVEDSQRRSREVARPVPIPAPSRSMFNESSSSEESIPSVQEEELPPIEEESGRGSVFTLAARTCETCGYSTMFNESSCYCDDSSSSEESLDQESLRRVAAAPLRDASTAASAARLLASSDEELELSMALFTVWSKENEEELAEPDTHDSLLMAALLSTMEESSATSEKQLHIVLYEYQAQQLDEMDMEVNDIIEIMKTVENGWNRGKNERTGQIAMYPSNYCEVYNATPVTSSISQYPMTSVALHAVSCPNLLMNSLGGPRRVPVHQPALSTIAEETSISCSCCSISTSNLFSDRPTALPYPMPSTLSVTGSAIVPYTSSASSLAIDASEVLVTSSSLLKDPTSAHSSFSSLLHMSTISYSSLGSSSSDHGYETDVDSAPVVRKSTVPERTQTEDADKASAARLIAECDEMVEKLEEKKKKLKELL